DFNDARLSRLIDGELSPVEYRAFLAALDDEPGGWRRCALALLESQALGHEISDLRRSIDQPTGVSPSSPLTVTRTAGLGPLSLLAISASFLVVFGLGLIAPKFFSRQAKDSILAGNFNTQRGVNDDSANDNAAMPRDIGKLQLVMDNGGGSETR